MMVLWLEGGGYELKKAKLGVEHCDQIPLLLLRNI